MKREIVFLVLSLFLLTSFVSANMENSFSEIQGYLDEYDSGELTAPQLMVYISYSRNKMYENADDQELSESEVKKVFDKVDRGNDHWRAEYQKVLEGEDFNVVFEARSFIKNNQEYYEDRGDSEKFYYVDYNIVPTVSSDFSFEEDLEDFTDKLEDMIDTDEKLDYETLQDEFSELRMAFNKKSREDKNYCENLIGSSDYEEVENPGDEYYESDKKQAEKIISVDTKKDCWTETGQCEEVCEEKEECNNDWGENCRIEEVCEPNCEQVLNDETNKTEEICGEDICSEKEVCDGAGDDCSTYEECYSDCDEEEVCNEWENGRLSINVECNEDGGNLWLNSWGEKFDKFQPINEGTDWNCESEIQSLVTMRKALQKDFNEEFLKWYFNDFIGEDYKKIIGGGDVLRDIVGRLINIDERVADSLGCSETGEWPEGFEKIDIVYDDGNTHFEVWEKFIPMEGMDTEYYTTMYKYYWAPTKEVAKELLNYMVQEEFVVGPQDVAKIKADEGQMALIETLADKYGGSFDIKLTLAEKEGDFEISRYIQINPDVAVKIQPEEIKTDIAVEIDFDVLYDFIITMTKKEEGNRIQGPYWVQIDDNGGADDFFSAIGSVSKAWREGVTITPKYALIKLFFTAKDIAAFVSSEGGQQSQNQGTSKISGEAILTRE